MNESVITAPLLLDLIRYAQQCGLAPQQIAPFAAALEGEEGRVPFSVYAELLELICRQTPDNTVGLHLGLGYNLSALGVVGQLVQTAENIGQAVQQAVDAFNLVSTVLQLELGFAADTFLLRFKIAPGLPDKHTTAARHFALASMVFAHQEIAYLSLRNCTPASARLEIPPGGRRSELLRYFGEPLLEEPGIWQLAYPRELLQQSILTADYQLHRHLQTIVEQQLAAFENKPLRTSERVTELMLKLSKPEPPDIRTVAAQLNCSVRDLQRKLRQEKTSYRQLRAALQKELAAAYLQQALSIKEIAYLLGFSQPSAFVHAFKRWYGVSPARYKATAMA